MKSMSKAPGAIRLKLKHDKLLSSYAFNFNMRRYTKKKKKKPRRTQSTASLDPDAELADAFALMDVQARGEVSFEEFSAGMQLAGWSFRTTTPPTLTHRVHASSLYEHSP